MRKTGGVRRFDDLGRIDIPKSVFHSLGFREGDPMEVFYEEDKTVILKPYDPNPKSVVDKPEESFDFKRDCKHTNYEIACGINNLSDSDFIEVFAELGILNGGKTLGETVKWLGEVLEEIRMNQCEEV